MEKYVLASRSPRRKQLLEWADIDFEIIVADTDESYPPGLTPAEVAMHIARDKALAVKTITGGNMVILAADTIVVLENDIIGKPKNRDHAVEILSRLSGRKHRVITGVSILATTEINFSDCTDVEFHSLTLNEIEFYIDKYHPYDKAGAYAIQEWIGVVGIKKITGDFYNVMGLPISRVVQALKELSSYR